MEKIMVVEDESGEYHDVVCISKTDFAFFYETFESLTSVYSDDSHISNAIRAENEIWERLKAIKSHMAGRDEPDLASAADPT
jgi:hypothetical protein